MAISWVAPRVVRQTRGVDLVGDLRRLGVAPGDVVMPHASLRAVGARAEAVIAALDEAVGPAGTLLMTIGARDDWAWVNKRPGGERAALLAAADPFDAATTPSDPEIGVLAEVFRRTPGTVVSDHPEGRFGARGARAAELIADVPWDDYYGAGSPLARLVEWGGKVLRMGADIDTVTLIHHAEYLATVPGKRRVCRMRRVRTAGGPVLRTVECLDDSDGIVDYPGPDYFGVILESYLATGAARRGRVGNAPSELLDARAVVEFAAGWMTEHFAGENPS